MKAILYFCLILGLLGHSSCVTYKRCMQKYPVARDTIRITQVRDSIIYRDTTIYTYIKGKDSLVFSEIPYPVPINTDKVRADLPLAWAEAWVERSVLMLKLVQKDTTIVTQLKNWKKEAYYWKEECEKINVVPPAPPPEKYIPKIYKYSLWILIVIVIAMGLKYAKKFNLLGIIKSFIK
jgi:hypothetical protein